jgi:cytoskeletal protein RodZ
MESFGAHLKSLREEKGKSLEDLAASTKIAVSNLDFLEKDRYDLLPPRVFVKGFIRSYVQELGLNPEETVRRFEAFTKEGEFPDYSDEEHPVFYQKPSTGTFISGTWFTVALTALGVVSLSILILAGVTRVFFSDER